MPIRPPTPRRIVIDYPLTNGDTRVVRFYREEWRVAYSQPFFDWINGLCEERIRDYALEEITRLSLGSPRPAAPVVSTGTRIVSWAVVRAFFARLVGGFVRVMRFDEACEMGGGAK